MASFNVTVEDSSPLISYLPASAWTDGSRDDAFVSLYSGKSFHATSAQGATATIKFKGTGFYIYGARRANYGPYSISIDGEVITNGQAHAGDAQFERLLGAKVGLKYGEHTAVLTNMGAGSAVDIDWVDFVGQVGGAGNMQRRIYDDADPAIVYGPTPDAWSTVQNDAHMGGTLHYTNTPGASASLQFRGNAVAIYTTMAANRADVTVTLNGRSSVVSGGSNSPTNALHTQTLMYYVDGLDASSNHSLLINSNSQTQDTPFIDLDRITVFTAENQLEASSAATLSTGVIAGIAVAGAAVLLLLGIGIFFLFRLRRKRRSLKERENERPNSPDSPMGRLPMQDPMMLEAGAVRPGMAWTPPSVHREPSYHQKQARSASRNGSIGASSMQSSSALMTLGVPKAQGLSRANSPVTFSDPGRAPSAMSYGEMDSGASTMMDTRMNPMSPESQSGMLPYPSGSQWDDSDTESPPKASKKASMASFFKAPSRNASVSSVASKPQDPRAFPVSPRARSRSRTRDDDPGHSRANSGNETDGGYSSAAPRAFPSKPISRPTTPNSRPVTPNRAPSRGHGAYHSAEQEAIDGMMRGRSQGEVRKKSSNRSLRNGSRSRQGGSGSGDALAQSSSFHAQRLHYESDGETSDAPVRSRSRSRTQHGHVAKQRSLTAAYEERTTTPPLIPGRNPARNRSREGHARNPGSLDRSFEMPVRQTPNLSSHPYATADTASLAVPTPRASPSRSAAHAQLQRSEHARSGSEASFLSVDPMSFHGGSRAPSPLSKVPSPGHGRTRSRDGGSRRHMRTPSDASASSHVSGHSVPDDSVRAGLATRKRSGSVSSVGEGPLSGRSEAFAFPPGHRPTGSASSVKRERSVGNAF